jgi:HPt (histidine-containing phosphotransfer) domain-containing protein
MTEPTDLSREPAVNVAELLTRVDNDYELLRELLDIFKVDSPRHLDALREAAAHADLKNVATNGHTLKGMLANLAATRATAAAGQLEHLGRSGDATGLDAALAILEKEMAALMPELEACVTKVQP